MYNFANPEYFFLIIPFSLFLYFLYKKWWNNIYFSDSINLKKIFKNNSIFYKIYYFVVFLIILLYICIFSNLIISEEKDKVNENGIDIQIVLDVSYSMLASDFEPNRLKVSKDIISKFISNLSWDRLWLVVFAWKPFSSLPLNFDYLISKKIVDKITVNTINQNNSRMQWTSIWDAIIIASDWFDKKSIGREKIMILLTDWDSNTWIEPIKATLYLKESKKTKDIKIYTIWIWWKKDAFIKTKDILWRTIKSKVWSLNEEVLKQISNNTWWKYFRASNEKTLENIFETISKLEKKELERETITVSKEKNIYFVYLLLFLSLVFIILKIKKNL